MRFFDREKEFEKLREIEVLSHEVAQFTIITGRRRIGKTEMVKKFYENKTILYFFVARKAERLEFNSLSLEISSAYSSFFLSKHPIFRRTKNPCSTKLFCRENGA